MSIIPIQEICSNTEGPLAGPPRSEGFFQSSDGFFLKCYSWRVGGGQTQGGGGGGSGSSNSNTNVTASSGPAAISQGHKDILKQGIHQHKYKYARGVAVFVHNWLSQVTNSVEVRRLAFALNQVGIELWAMDMSGHGLSTTKMRKGKGGNKIGEKGKQEKQVKHGSFYNSKHQRQELYEVIRWKIIPRCKMIAQKIQEESDGNANNPLQSMPMTMSTLITTAGAEDSHSLGILQKRTHTTPDLILIGHGTGASTSLLTTKLLLESKICNTQAVPFTLSIAIAPDTSAFNSDTASVLACGVCVCMSSKTNYRMCDHYLCPSCICGANIQTKNENWFIPDAENSQVIPYNSSNNLPVDVKQMQMGVGRFNPVTDKLVEARCSDACIGRFMTPKNGGLINESSMTELNNVLEQNRKSEDGYGMVYNHPTLLFITGDKDSVSSHRTIDTLLGSFSSNNQLTIVGQGGAESGPTQKNLGGETGSHRTEDIVRLVNVEDMTHEPFVQKVVWQKLIYEEILPEIERNLARSKSIRLLPSQERVQYHAQLSGIQNPIIQGIQQSVKGPGTSRPSAAMATPPPQMQMTMSSSPSQIFNKGQQQQSQQSQQRQGPPPPPSPNPQASQAPGGPLSSTNNQQNMKPGAKRKAKAKVMVNNTSGRNLAPGAAGPGRSPPDKTKSETMSRSFVEESGSGANNDGQEWPSED